MLPVTRISVVHVGLGGLKNGLTIIGLRELSSLTSNLSAANKDVDKRSETLHPSLEVKKFPGVTQQALKRGTGGRSSFNGVVCTVFGAGSQTGKSLLNQLGKIGTQLIIPYRGDPYYIQRLKLVGDLGQTHYTPIHLKDEDSLRRAMKYSNVVVNLIGKDSETKNFSFDEVHINGPRRIARIARELGVERLIHVGALDSCPEPPPGIFKKGCQFLRSKYWGEVAVREEFPDAIIIRPADIFGHTDRYATWYVHVYRRQFHKIPLWNAGIGIYKQPIYVNDVGKGIAAAALDDDSPGKTYDFLGPKRYQLQDLVRYMNQCIQKDEEFGYYIKDLRWSPTFLVRAWFLPKVRPIYPPVCIDKLEKELVSNFPVEGNLRIEDLGIELTEPEQQLKFDLEQWRRLAHYDDALGEFPPPPYPPTVTAL